MKPGYILLSGSLLAACAAGSAFAGDRDTLALGSAIPSAAQVETFLFPEAQCESAGYQCMGVRPQTERSIGMYLKFATGSAVLTAEAREQLEGLGRALAARNGKLNPAEIIVEGHADPRGSADANRVLSAKRAESVVKYLVEAFRIDPKSLKPVGRGAEALKDRANPEAAVNRRVELVRRAI